MATVEQVTAIKDLNESNDRTPAGWDQTKGDYKFAGNDPYELRHAKAKLATPVSIATTGTALDISADAGTSDVAAEVTLWDTTTVTAGIVYAIATDPDATNATIDQDGLVTASGTAGEDGTITTTATLGDLVATETIVISGQV